jgi:hypothetical protein
MTLKPLYKKDSKSHLKVLKNLHIPPNAKLFTADTVTMYTNVDTMVGLQAIQEISNKYHEAIPSTFPKDFFLSTLEMIISNSIFTFRGSFCLQLQDTAMGTPATPLYSILTFGLHENKHILTTF